MTKRTIAALLALTMSMSALSVPASAVSASTAESSGMEYVGQIKKNTKFVYKIRSDGKVMILDLKDKAINSAGTLTLPSKIDGRQVVSVTDDASDFLRMNCKKIKLVVIPDTIMGLPQHTIGYTDERVDSISPNNDETYGYKRYTGVKIKCGHDTYAEQYAVDNGIKYTFRNKDDELKGVIWKSKYSISTTAIRFRWYEVEGADGYEIHRYIPNGGSKLLKTIKGSKNTEYKDSKLKRGTNYKYVVVPYRIKNGLKDYGGYSAPLEFSTRPAAPEVSKAAPTREHSVAVRVKNLNPYGDSYRAEILDPDTNKWCEAAYETYDMDGNDCILQFSGYYCRNPFSGSTFLEPLVSGGKYKLRLCRRGRVEMYCHYKYLVGDYCKTLTLKAK